MDATPSDSTTDVPDHLINFGLSRFMCLIVFSTLIMPSVMLALLVFYVIFRMPELRARLTNHIILSIFVVCFIQVNLLKNSTNHLDNRCCLQKILTTYLCPSIKIVVSMSKHQKSRSTVAVVELLSESFLRCWTEHTFECDIFVHCWDLATAVQLHLEFQN